MAIKDDRKDIQAQLEVSKFKYLRVTLECHEYRIYKQKRKRIVQTNKGDCL